MLNYTRRYKVGLILAALLLPSATDAKKINGFELDDALIPAKQIFSGGPEKDGIPAIDNPKFIKVRAASFLKDSDRVLGITIDDTSKAYPIKILNWHEIVNDSIAGVFYAITYCPLCGTGMAFDSNINDQVLNFGVSGLLYNSDVLLYDRESESLWSQLLSKAVTGRHKGSVLKSLPVMHTTWANWKRLHPSSLVLSSDTGYKRSYSKDPYSGYEKSRSLYFPVSNKAPIRYHPKERVLGLSIGITSKAYPFTELNKNDQSIFTDVVNGAPLTIHWNKKEQTGFVTNEQGTIIPIVQSYWFAWYAFHPDTELFIK